MSTLAAASKANNKVLSLSVFWWYMEPQSLSMLQLTPNKRYCCTVMWASCICLLLALPFIPFPTFIRMSAMASCLLLFPVFLQKWALHEIFLKQWFQVNWVKLQLQHGQSLQPLEVHVCHYHGAPFCLFGCANFSKALVPSMNCLLWLNSRHTCLLAFYNTRSATFVLRNLPMMIKELFVTSS